jgi:ribosomal protein S6
MENRGIIRKIENLGEKDLPYRIRAHSKIFCKGRYILFDTEVPPTVLPSLRWKLGLNENVIRCTVLSKSQPTSTVTHKDLLNSERTKRTQHSVKSVN